MPPETSHHVTLAALRLLHRVKLAGLFLPAAETCPRQLLGLAFPNPVGLAAGLDKNGDYLDALAGLGFGFIELGTVTPRPQPGNPPPRLFRLAGSQALINRMGFNNKGVDYLAARLESRRSKGVLGVNIGKNAATPLAHAWQDYHFCLERVFALADYVTVNISSPNTAGLRSLQQQDELRQLLGRLREQYERLAAKHACRPPLLVKLAPDLSREEVEQMAPALAEADGVIATNTTVQRPGLESHASASEPGGLSGAPLGPAAARLLGLLADVLPEGFPLISAGGIMNPEDACQRFAAGASLVQLYTGLIYQGPKLIAGTVQRLARQEAAETG